MMQIMITAIQATRCVRVAPEARKPTRRRRKSLVRVDDVAAAGGRNRGGAASLTAASSRQPDARVDIGIENVDQQIDAENENRLKDDHRLQQRKVTVDH